MKKRTKAKGAPSKRNTETDPFTVIGSTPKGLAYQWVAQSVMGDKEAANLAYSTMGAAGWRPVPSRRHPSMPNDGHGHIVHDGQMLMQRSAKAVRKAIVKSEHIARDMAAKAGGSAPTRIFDQLCAEPWEFDLKKAKEKLLSINGRSYAEFTITAGLVLTDREIETAAALGLEFGEYARRQVMMIGNCLLRINEPLRNNMPVFQLAQLVATVTTVKEK